MGINKKAKRIFDKKVSKHGQSAILHKEIPGERCPCFNSDTGYCDPQWHRDNPIAPNCNDEGYLTPAVEEVTLKSFIFPASDASKKSMEELILATIGEIRKDEYVYIGKSDIDIFNLLESDYLIFKNKKWKIKNPDVYMLGDIELAYIARLELIGDV